MAKKLWYEPGNWTAHLWVTLWIPITGLLQVPIEIEVGNQISIV